jgi:hypothetical protein
MNKARVGFFLGAWAWAKCDASWIAVLADEARAFELLFQKGDSLGDIALLYEPAGISHERIAGAFHSRREFRESLRNRDRFPVIDRVECAWGFDSCRSESAVEGETFVHSEFRPRLARLIAQAELHQHRIISASSLLTVASTLNSRAEYSHYSPVAMVVANDYIGIALHDSKGRPCSFKAWQGEIGEQTWRAVVAFLRELRVCAESPAGGLNSYPLRGLLIYREGNALESCPRLEAWQALPDQVTVCGFDELAAQVVAVDARLPSNLVKSFGQKRQLLTQLRYLAVIFAISASVSWCLDVRTSRESVAEDLAYEKIKQVLAAREQHLLRNKSTIVEASSRREKSVAPLAPLLQSLAVSLPESAVLQGIDIRESDEVTLRGSCLGRKQDLRKLIDGLSKAGLVDEKLSFDDGNRTWSLAGTLRGAPHAN